MKIFRFFFLAIIFSGFFSLTSASNKMEKEEVIANRLKNLDKYEIKTFYDSTFSLLSLLKNISDKELGEKWTNKLFEIIKNKKGIYGNRLHWIQMEIFTDSLKLNYLNSAEVLAKSYNSEINIAWVNYTKSVYYEQKHIYDKSIKYLLIAKDIYEELENNKYLSLIGYLSGKLYLASQQYEIAISHFKIALKKLTGSAEFINERQFILLNNIGNTYIKLENYKLAIQYFNKALKENFNNLDQLQKPRAISYLYSLFAEAYLEEDNLQKAKELINKALEVSKEEDDYFLASYFNYLKSKIEYEEGDFNKSLKSIKKGFISLEKSKRSFVLRPKMLKHLSAIYNKLGNSDAAYDNLNRYNLLEDSLEEAANTTKSLLLIAKKKHEKIDRENESNRLKFIYTVWLAIFLLLFFVILLFFYLKVRKANLKLMEKALETETSFISKEKRLDVKKDKNLQILVSNIEEIMKNEKPYLDKDFSLSQAATLFSTNTRYLSNAINTILNKNFSTYVNSFRIKYAVELIKSGESEKTTIEGIALKSGFKNKSVFNIAFNNFTGVTPSFFIKNYRSQILN